MRIINAWLTTAFGENALYQEQFYNLSFPFPTLGEQTAIASYLGRGSKELFFMLIIDTSKQSEINISLKEGQIYK